MYHFIGIKGSGMSALAVILHDLGYVVQGSDIESHLFTQVQLEEKNIKMLPFSKNNIKEGMVIIQGNAFKDDHEEVIKAKELGLTIRTYSQMVGKLTKMFKTITVAGCHGKTTTTALMSHVFDSIVGCNYLIGDGTGHANKENKLFALEACEYRRHFLDYSPYYAVITNIELDHVDYFNNIDDVIDAYREYANNAEKMVIACGDDRYTHTLEVNPPIFYYGLDDDNEIQARDVNYTEKGTSFDVFVEDNYYGHFDLPIFGKHILLDTLAVIGVCYYERLDAKSVNSLIKTFKGANRRFTETIVNDNIVIDDYAHHPTEVKLTIKAARQKYPNKELIAVFQPHTFSRTTEFADEYIEALSKADRSFVLDVHGARETNDEGKYKDSNYIIENTTNCEHIDINEADKLLKYKDAVILFMSPNDISDLENNYINKYKEKQD